MTSRRYLDRKRVCTQIFEGQLESLDRIVERDLDGDKCVLDLALRTVCAPQVQALKRWSVNNQGWCRWKGRFLKIFAYRPSYLLFALLIQLLAGVEQLIAKVALLMIKVE